MEKWSLITDFILVSGMAILALSILLLLKSTRQFSKKILIVFFASTFFFLLYYYSYLHRIRILGAISIFFGNGVGFLIGPLLLFQIKSLVMPKALFVRDMYRQLIPFGLIWLFVSVPLSISMATEYRGYVNWYVRHEPFFNIPENIFFLFYIAAAFRYLSMVTNQVRENYSSLKSNDLSWYRNLLAGLAIIVLIDTGCTVYELYFPMVPWNIGTLVAFSFVALYTYLGYKGMFQSEILLPQFLNDQKPGSAREQGSPPRKKTAGPLERYSADEIEKLRNELYSVLENKKPYLNESLSLTDLADEMNISSKKLSDLLNQHMDVSFYNLINDFRLREVTECMFLPEYSKYTLAGLANECGFQSKATFNRIFKQKFGMSPSQYKEAHLPDRLARTQNVQA